MRAFSLVVVLFAFAGCRQPPTGLAADLPGSTWTVERVVLGDGAVLRGADDQVTFGTDGTLRLSSCNSCNGRFRMRGDVLRVEGPVACTKRACTDDRIELERYLTGDVTVRLDGQYLVVETGPEAAEAGAQVLLLPDGAVLPDDPTGL